MKMRHWRVVVKMCSFNFSLHMQMSLHDKIAVHVTGSKKQMFFENDLNPGCLLQMFLLEKEHILHHPRVSRLHPLKQRVDLSSYLLRHHGLICQRLQVPTS